MGQYHVVVNADKRHFLHPHRLGDGLKLMEFGNSTGGVTLALVILLAVSNNRGGGDLRSDNELIGSWGGDRIAIVGDYAEDSDLPSTFDPEPKSIYRRCVSPWTSHVVAHPDGTSLHSWQPTTHKAAIDELLAKHPEWHGLPFYRDISADVRACIEADGIYTFGKDTGGWIDRTSVYDEPRRSLRPDMVIAVPKVP